MKRIFLFDVDGTLTKPREPMHPDFEPHFREFVRDNAVYLASGSDLLKIQEQVPQDILDACRGIFSSSGNQLDIRGDLVYKNSFDPSEELKKFLESHIEKSDYKVKTGKHIEHRPGMINFSVVGRNADSKQRKEYYKWDHKEQERKKIAVLLMSKFPELDVKIGGEISIDIYPRGLDKSQAVRYIKSNHDDAKIRFFGDRTDKDGNDYSVVMSLEEGDGYHSVKNCLETKDLLLCYIKGELF